MLCVFVSPLKFYNDMASSRVTDVLVISFEAGLLLLIVVIIPEFEWHLPTHKSAQTFWIWIEDTEGDMKIHYKEQFMLQYKSYLVCDRFWVILSWFAKYTRFATTSARYPCVTCPVCSLVENRGHINPKIVHPANLMRYEIVSACEAIMNESFTEHFRICCCIELFCFMFWSEASLIQLCILVSTTIREILASILH